VVAATVRIVTSTSKQTTAINRVAQSLDPMIAAAARAQRQMETLTDISAQGGPQGARADGRAHEALDVSAGRSSHRVLSPWKNQTRLSRSK
jgi:hypothetical protein